jgi:hypothetical protein
MDQHIVRSIGNAFADEMNRNYLNEKSEGLYWNFRLAL